MNSESVRGGWVFQLVNSATKLGCPLQQRIGDDQTMRCRRTILLDPQFQVDAGLLREKQMPALDRRPPWPLPTCRAAMASSNRTLPGRV